jgi:hypothetical protein
MLRKSPRAQRWISLRAQHRPSRRPSDPHCAASEHPGVYLQSDGAIFLQLVSEGVPPQLAFQWHPRCEMHDDCEYPARLHDDDTPLHDLDVESQ